jgi:hypothetical protein
VIRSLARRVQDLSENRPHRQSFLCTALSKLQILPSPHPRLLPELVHERSTLLALSRESLDTSNTLHAKALHMLYECCVRRPCPARFGSHWESLGFQGKDPGTDFRGAGMLALMHLLHMFAYNHDNAERVWRLSSSEKRVRFAALAYRDNPCTVSLAITGAPPVHYLSNEHLGT